MWRVRAKCHEMRNRAEYESVLEVIARVVVDLIAAREKIEMKVYALVPIKEST